MSRPILEKLIDKWTNEPAFRKALRRDPDGALMDAGLELDHEELAALKAADWSLSDDELELRLSKAG